jgi:hypothetical protein
MLDLPRYLLGVLEIACSGGFATLGASALARTLLPAFAGAPAPWHGVIALRSLIWCGEVLGRFGLFEPLPYLLVVTVVGLGLWLGVEEGGSALSRSGVLFSPDASQAARLL